MLYEVITVIFNCPNGELLNNPEAKKMLAAAVLEGQSVAKALGINVTEDPVSQTRAVCAATAGNISSMLQDVRRGRQTEIGAINGALLAKAEELGMNLPVNRDLVERIKEIEAGYLRTEPRGYRITSYNVCYTKLLRTMTQETKLSGRFWRRECLQGMAGILMKKFLEGALHNLPDTRGYPGRIVRNNFV